jgi:methionine-rich copper-binding protein CopC
MRKIAAFLTAVAATLILLPPAAVRAHADLVDASPGPGAQLTETPGEIRLTFSEPVGAGSFIEVYGEGFRSVGPLEPQFDAAHPEQFYVSLPELTAGTYTVQWSAASADGHEVSGSYRFTVLPATPAGSPSWLVVGLVAAGAAATVLFLASRRR